MRENTSGCVYEGRDAWKKHGRAASRFFPAEKIACGVFGEVCGDVCGRKAGVRDIWISIDRTQRLDWTNPRGLGTQFLVDLACEDFDRREGLEEQKGCLGVGSGAEANASRGFEDG